MKTGPIIFTSALAILAGCVDMSFETQPEGTGKPISPGLEEAKAARANGEFDGEPRRMFLLTKEGTTKAMLLDAEGAIITAPPAEAASIAQLSAAAADGSQNPFNILNLFGAQQAPNSTVATPEAVEIAQVSVAQAQPQNVAMSDEEFSPWNIDWTTVFGARLPESAPAELIGTSAAVTASVAQLPDAQPKIETPSAKPVPVTKVTSSIKTDSANTTSNSTQTVTTTKEIEPATVTSEPSSAKIQSVTTTDDKPIDWTELFTAPASTAAAESGNAAGSADGAPATNIDWSEVFASEKTGEEVAEIASVEVDQAPAKNTGIFQAGKSIELEIERNWKNQIARIEFDGGKLTGETDCITFAGSYTKVSNTKIRVGSLNTTPKSCDSEVAKQASDSFVKALPGNYDVLFEGSNMVLRGGNSMFQFSNL